MLRRYRDRDRARRPSITLRQLLLSTWLAAISSATLAAMPPERREAISGAFAANRASTRLVLKIDYQDGDTVGSERPSSDLARELWRIEKAFRMSKHDLAAARSITICANRLRRT